MDAMLHLGAPWGGVQITGGHMNWEEASRRFDEQNAAYQESERRRLAEEQRRQEALVQAAKENQDKAEQQRRETEALNYQRAINHLS